GWIERHIRAWLISLWSLSIAFSVPCSRADRLQRVHSCRVLKNSELAAKVIVLDRRVRCLLGWCLRRGNTFRLHRCCGRLRRLREGQRDKRCRCKCPGKYVFIHFFSLDLNYKTLAQLAAVT